MDKVKDSVETSFGYKRFSSFRILKKSTRNTLKGLMLKLSIWLSDVNSWFIRKTSDAGKIEGVEGEGRRMLRYRSAHYPLKKATGQSLRWWSRNIGSWWCQRVHGDHESWRRPSDWTTLARNILVKSPPIVPPLEVTLQILIYLFLFCKYSLSKHLTLSWCQRKGLNFIIRVLRVWMQRIFWKHDMWHKLWVKTLCSPYKSFKERSFRIRCPNCIGEEKSRCHNQFLHPESSMERSFRLHL